MDDALITDFFKCAKKTINENDTGELFEIIDRDVYFDLEVVYEMFKKDELKYSAREQIEGYLIDKARVIEKFVNDTKKKYPDMKIEKKDDYESEFLKTLKKYR